MSDIVKITGRRELKQLDEREQFFVTAYMIDFNAKKSALMAGYPRTVAEVKAHTWIKPNGPKPHVAYAVMIAMQERERHMKVRADRVLLELEKIAFSNMKDYVRFDDPGGPMFDLQNISDDAASVIKEITLETYTEGKGEAKREVKKINLKLHDKKGALIDLGKHLGLFKEADGKNPNVPGQFDRDGNPVGQIPEHADISRFEIELIPTHVHFTKTDEMAHSDAILAEIQAEEKLELELQAARMAAQT